MMIVSKIIMSKLKPSYIKNVIRYRSIFYYYHFAGLSYYFFRLLPKKNKVVATAFQGRKYGDNPQYIIEKLHEINPSAEIVWLVDKDYQYQLPSYVKAVSFYNHLRKAYELSTAKVWISTHRIERNVKKRPNQLFIETWHGGLGIKKLDGDVPKFESDRRIMQEVNHTSELADLFISNSAHLTRIYRSAFHYYGKVWKCGYPKNDVLFNDNSIVYNKIRNYYNISNGSYILLYVPTFRDWFSINGIDASVYDIDYMRLLSALQSLITGEWYVFVRFHPFLINAPELRNIEGDHIINVTSYPDVEELILGADAAITDYSSCIFDAAMREIPCFTYAKDFEDYKGDRGVYYEMDELPFPYAKDNEELIANIQTFDISDYLIKWNKFKERTGLYETGHASEDIALLIGEYMNNNKEILGRIENDS